MTDKPKLNFLGHTLDRIEAERLISAFEKDLANVEAMQRIEPPRMGEPLVVKSKRPEWKRN